VLLATFTSLRWGELCGSYGGGSVPGPQVIFPAAELVPHPVYLFLAYTVGGELTVRDVCGPGAEFGGLSVSVMDILSGG
jgi:hypothetical protein